MKKQAIFFGILLSVCSPGRSNNQERISEKGLFHIENRLNTHAEVIKAIDSLPLIAEKPFDYSIIDKAATSAAAGSVFNTPKPSNGHTPEAETSSPTASTDEYSKSQPWPRQQAAGTPHASTGDGFEKGKSLVENSGCISCHQIDQKITGPAYLDIAKKYTPTEANITALTAKIINGGAGNWGQMSMDPHPYLREADVREMVKYILSLK